MTIELVQGSDEWKFARVGSAGASRISEITATAKSGGYLASRENVLAELLCERLTGVPAQKFVTAAMEDGTRLEPEGRAAYEFRANVDVQQVGLITHPTIQGSHASPDGLVGDDGLLEIKCPQPAAHINVLLSGKIPQNYVKQMLWQMACTGRQWCDFVSYCPKLPEEMRLFVSRVYRDQGAIDILEKEVRLFLADLDAKERALREQFMKQAA